MISQLPLFSQGVEALLSREADVEVVGRDSDIDTALIQLKWLRPDVVILDSECHADDLPSIAARILTAHKDARVIAMSLEDNTASVFVEEHRAIHEMQDLMHAITNTILDPDHAHTKGEARSSS